MNRITCNLFWGGPNSSNESHEPPRQCYTTYKTRTLIFESSRTHKLVVRYKVIYWPYELPMSAQTCTHPRSEVGVRSLQSVCAVGRHLSRYPVGQLGCGLTIKNRCPLKAGRRHPGLAQRMRNLMPKNAETVSRRPKIVIVWHNQCQAEPMSSPCRYLRHQVQRARTSM